LADGRQVCDGALVFTYLAVEAGCPWLDGGMLDAFVEDVPVKLGAEL
jgi:hypothetical protein